MSWWTAIFGEPSEWRLCGQIDAGYVVTSSLTGAKKSGCVITYFLYEDQDGKRKFDIIDSEDGDVEIKTLKKTAFAYRNDVYRNTIRPWLDGRRDPNIPTWEQVPRHDFKRVLTGKK